MEISKRDFDAAVREAIAGLPQKFKDALQNIAITTADEPSKEQLASAHVEHGELLGLYQGTPITKRGFSFAGELPDVITIFRGPHERVCHTHKELITQIQKTVLHEIGHYFGFDDAYLHSHGY
ncbi:Zn-dependent protease [Bifidobacterium anseris]|uniref:Zn-dependent protease n=1 Tax=Bifidobacterium anseris TaxID=2020963 RepID=A0A2N5J2J9_9BIFI|nr:MULTISPECIES: metallopeptidase family protein [Bifidobacterium]PLS28434.1 Zn-dependent protease [Bifidobacterium anseris]